jgi:hypothetical protein
MKVQCQGIILDRMKLTYVYPAIYMVYFQLESVNPHGAPVLFVFQAWRRLLLCLASGPGTPGLGRFLGVTALSTPIRAEPMTGKTEKWW